MGRVLLYAVLATLAFFVLATAFLLDSGGGPTEAVAEISVHDLSVSPRAYDGEEVRTEGVLRRFAEPEERFLVTADGLGVLIRGYSAQELRRLDGRTVAVSGRFGFDEATGAYIEADSVTPLH